MVANESSTIAIDINTKEPVSFGSEALTIARRTPGSVKLVNPVFEGSVSDHDGLAMVLDEMFRAAAIQKPEIILALSSGSNEAERSALVEILLELGARSVEYINMPTACLLGSKADLGDERAVISLNIGAGATDIGVVKGCVTRYEQAVKYGCTKLDDAVESFIKREFNVAVDENTLFDIRKVVGSVHPSFDAGSFEFRGRDLVTGLPVALAITSEQTRKAMLPIAKYICGVVGAMVKSLPDKLAEEVRSRGLLISGGGALTGGMDELLKETTGLPVVTSPRVTDCIIEGIGVAIENRGVFNALIKDL